VGCSRQAYDKTVRRLWTCPTARSRNASRGTAITSYSVVFHRPDGKRFLSASQNLVRLWDLKSGKELRQFKGHTQNVVHVRFRRPQAVCLGQQRPDGPPLGPRERPQFLAPLLRSQAAPGSRLALRKRLPSGVKTTL